MEPGKKISFGFNKLSKKTNLIRYEEKQVEFVDCLEGQSIKLKHEIKVVEKEPLVIPLLDNKKDLLDRVRDMKAKHKNKTEIEDTRPDSELTEDELVAREVVREAKLRLSQQNTADSKVFVLPVKMEDEIPLEGKKESTLDDYNNVPVTDFGLAMLRGMGWKEGIGIGKNPTNTSTVKPPELRPKGLGLGASALANSEKQNKPVTDKNGEVLILKKGSYAKIVAGNKKGNYCEVQGLDDEAGRIIVKTTLKGEILTLNEFMLIAVTKDEYSKSSKVLNNAKFEEYKEMEHKNTKTKVKYDQDKKSYKEENYKTEKNGKIKKEKHNSDGEKSEKDVKSKIKTNKTEERSDSSDDTRHSRKNKKDKTSKYSKKHDNSSDSDSDYEKSRKTHKRKDKKRHRDKSRSPIRSKYKSGRKSSKSKHRYSSSDSESERESKDKNRNKSYNDDSRHRRNK